MDILEQVAVGLLALGIGLAFAFAGWKWFLILLPIWGFFAGLVFGANTVQVIFGDGFLSTVTSWVVGFFVGILFAVLSYFFYWFAVVLLGASVGFALGQAFGVAIGTGSTLTWIFGAIVAVVFAFGTIALRVPRYLVIVLTAVGGAGAAVGGILILFGVVKVDSLSAGEIGLVIRQSIVWSIAAIVVALAGIWVQVQTTAMLLEIDRASYRYP